MVGVVVLLFLIFASRDSVHAATITVRSASDGAANVANCPGVNCRLRDAIAAAASSDTINFSLTGCPCVITLTGGQLDISKNLTISGPGESMLVLDGNNTSKVMLLTLNVIVNISGLTIKNGLADFGGGIEVGSSTRLNLSFATVESNSAAVYSAGGLGNEGITNLSNVTFRNNSAYAAGGAIHNDGALTLASTTFTGNSVTAAGAHGGGLSNHGSATLTNVTFSGNSATSGGGAISAGGIMTITNSTFFSNTANFGSTIELNGGTVTLYNTIVANNTPNANCASTILDGGNNLQFGGSVPDSCGVTIVTPVSNPLGTNTLANNGGSTQTIALPPDSVAIDAANPAHCPPTDQRGFPRSVNCDIGAYEYWDFTHQVFLPLIAQSPLPTPVPNLGINGRVNFNGSSVASIPLDLRFYNGSAWSTISSTLTDGSGNYSFQSAPTLGAGQGYYVRYSNSADSSKLFFWGTQILTSYAAGSSVVIGNFDIANIPLVSPPNAATVSLPQTFQWTLRTATPTDSYQLSLFDPSNANLTAYTPLLGYVNAVTINGLPPGFNAGVPYGWFIAVNSPDGGYGESYYYRQITFTNTSAGPSKFAPASNRLNRSDLPLPKHQR